MSTIRKLITKGLREAGIIEVGTDPDAAEFEEGLDMLQGLYLSFFGNELGEPLANVNYGSEGLTNSYAKDEDRSNVIDSAYIPNNVRLILNIGEAETLYLHPNPRDGARVAIIDNGGNVGTYNVTINGNGRQIENAASVTLDTDSVSQQWFYRADLGNWAKIIDLDAADESPLPREFDDLLTTGLALRLNPRYGAQTSQEMSDILNRMRKQFRARYRQTAEQDSELGLYRLTTNRSWTYRNSTQDFDRGN